MRLPGYLTVLALVASASAQIPTLGWCPDYKPMAKFDMERFMGSWYEAERTQYFSLSELGSRCVATSFEKIPGGSTYLMRTELISSLTGLKRVVDGTLQMIGPEGEGRMGVKYDSLTIPTEVHYSILDTDYDTYSIMWSCSGIGLLYVENAWLMTRDRVTPPAVLQRAYGILDKYKIRRNSFYKTNQLDCSVLPPPVLEADHPAAPQLIEEENEESSKSVVSLEENKKDAERSTDKTGLETIAIPEEPILSEEKKPEKKPEDFKKPEDLKGPEDLKKPEKDAVLKI